MFLVPCFSYKPYVLNSLAGRKFMCKQLSIPMIFRQHNFTHFGITGDILPTPISKCTLRPLDLAIQSGCQVWLRLGGAVLGVYGWRSKGQSLNMSFQKRPSRRFEGWKNGAKLGWMAKYIVYLSRYAMLAGCRWICPSGGDGNQASMFEIWKGIYGIYDATPQCHPFPLESPLIRPDVHWFSGWLLLGQFRIGNKPYLMTRLNALDAWNLVNICGGSFFNAPILWSIWNVRLSNLFASNCWS